MIREIILAFTVLACTSLAFGQKVGYEAKDVDFTTYESFNFMDITFDDSLLVAGRQRTVGILKSGISQELESRGIRFSLEADIEINVLISVTDQKITRETDFRDIQRGYGTGTSRNYSWEAEELIVRQYQKGNATLDFVDANDSTLIWQGIIEETREQGEDYAKLEKRLKKSIQKLMKKFPVKSKI